MCGQINSHATVHVCYYVLFAHFTFLSAIYDCTCAVGRCAFFTHPKLQIWSSVLRKCKMEPHSLEAVLIFSAAGNLNLKMMTMYISESIACQ